LTSVLIFDPPYLVRKTLASGLRIDYIGLGLLATGLGALEIMLDEGQRNDWFSSHGIVAAAAIASVALLSVVFWELRTKDPVIEMHLLKERNFAISTATMFVLGFVLYGSTMALPLFLQTLLGYTAMQSGMALSPGGLAIMVMMPIVGVLLSRVEARWLVIFGLLISAYGLYQMSLFNLQIDFRHAVESRIVQSLGLAFLFVPINTMAFYFIARERTSYATGLINLARNIGGSSGIALSTTLIARRQQFHQHRLIEHFTPFDPTYQAMLESAKQMFLSKGADAAHAASQAQQLVYAMIQRQASMQAFLDDFRLMAIIFVAVIPLMFLMKKMRPHKAEIIAE
jgi:DHA2 family multidrug resistance protein